MNHIGISSLIGNVPYVAMWKQIGRGDIPRNQMTLKTGVPLNRIIVDVKDIDNG